MPESEKEEKDDVTLEHPLLSEDEELAAEQGQASETEPLSRRLRRRVFGTCTSKERVAAAIGIFFVVAVLVVVLYEEEKPVHRPSPEHAPEQLQPVVINTWRWPQTSLAALVSLQSGGSALDAAQAGCRDAELSFAYGDGTVGPDGSPDTNGEVTLDALLQDGDSLHVGAVAFLRSIPSAIDAARSVMDYSSHSLMQWRKLLCSHAGQPKQHDA
jgi:hypothetical protein